MQILASLDRDKNSSISVAGCSLVAMKREQGVTYSRTCVFTKITNWAYEWGETYGQACFAFYWMTNWTCQWKRQAVSTGASEISTCDKKEASFKFFLFLFIYYFFSSIKNQTKTKYSLFQIYAPPPQQPVALIAHWCSRFSYLKNVVYPF